MSSRKDSIITGCRGFVQEYPFGGDYVTRNCSEGSFSSNFSECSEFRKSVNFKRLRNSDVEA